MGFALRLFLFAAMGALCWAPTSHAQAEFFNGGEAYYAAGGFFQSFKVDGREARGQGAEFEGYLTSEVVLSLGFARTAQSQGSGRPERASAVVLGVSILARRPTVEQPVTVEAGVGLGRASTRSTAEAFGTVGLRLVYTLVPDQPVSPALSVEGGATVPVFASDVGSTQAVSVGVGLGMRLAPELVVFARPRYTFTFGGEEVLRAHGVQFGIAFKR